MPMGTVTISPTTTPAPSRRRRAPGPTLPTRRGRTRRTTEPGRTPGVPTRLRPRAGSRPPVDQPAPTTDVAEGAARRTGPIPGDPRRPAASTVHKRAVPPSAKPPHQPSTEPRRIWAIRAAQRHRPSTNERFRPPPHRHTNRARDPVESGRSAPPSGVDRPRTGLATAGLPAPDDRAGHDGSTGGAAMSAAGLRRRHAFGPGFEGRDLRGGERQPQGASIPCRPLRRCSASYGSRDRDLRRWGRRPRRSGRGRTAWPRTWRRRPGG